MSYSTTMENWGIYWLLNRQEIAGLALVELVSMHLKVLANLPTVFRLRQSGSVACLLFHGRDTADGGKSDHSWSHIFPVALVLQEDYDAMVWIVTHLLGQLLQTEWQGPCGQPDLDHGSLLGL